MQLREAKSKLCYQTAIRYNWVVKKIKIGDTDCIFFRWLELYIFATTPTVYFCRGSHCILSAIEPYTFVDGSNRIFCWRCQPYTFADGRTITVPAAWTVYFADGRTVYFCQRLELYTFASGWTVYYFCRRLNCIFCRWLEPYTFADGWTVYFAGDVNRILLPVESTICFLRRLDSAIKYVIYCICLFNQSKQ